MPKPSTFPTLFDSVLQLNIDKLKKNRFIIPGRIRSGTYTWSRDGNETGSIGFTVDMTSVLPYIELDYKYGAELRKYRIFLVSVPSNLGAGEVWYFLCPHTGKRCRILYCVGGEFLHREAFRNVYYDSQIRSKWAREIDRLYGPLFKTDKLYDQLDKKYFKPYYAGRPTKKHLKIMRQLARANKISIDEFEKILTRKI